MCDLQRRLNSQGVPLTSEAAETTTGPASITAVDPDGNPILVDQHLAANTPPRTHAGVCNLITLLTYMWMEPFPDRS